MFKCGDCEILFDEPETVRESRGEFYGMPAYEDISICPYCGSEFIDIVLDLKNNSKKVLTN